MGPTEHLPMSESSTGLQAIAARADISDVNPVPRDDTTIALLIDADNAPATKIDFIIAELATYGVVNIRRAYGNWTKSTLSGWQAILHDFAIQPVQHFDLVKGKNGSDMALLIDAMDILYTKSARTFCLVSSDCDFTPLVLRLRAEGRQVIGFGDHKTPAPFVNSCTKFLYLDDAVSNAHGTPANRAKPDQIAGDKKLMQMLRNAVDATADEDGWAFLGGVGSHLSNQGSFDSRNYGYSKLSDLFAALPGFDIQKTPSGGNHHFRVRLRS